MRTLLAILLIALVTPASVGSAQSPPTIGPPASAANPLSAHNRFVYKAMQGILLRSAELMPEESYGFRPTDTVRTFGQLIGHEADAQYIFCSAVLGEPSPRPRVEQTRTSKADLIAGLKDAFAYCDRAYDGMSDASGIQMVKFRGGDTPKLSLLGVNLIHTVLHYGNLATYLRMKNIVPPSSEPGFQP